MVRPVLNDQGRDHQPTPLSLFFGLLGRELRSRYAGTAGGWAWALLHPLMLLGLYALVFDVVFQVRLPEAKPGQPYLLWIALTLWPWLAFQEGVLRGTAAVVQHGALVKKVAFPTEMLVASQVAAAFMLHALGQLLVLLVVWVLGLEWFITALPIWAWAWLSLGLMALAGAWFLAALQVFVRDVEHLLSQATSLLFYASPVLYPLSMVPEAWRVVLAWNPLTPVLETLRQAGLGLAGGAEPMLLLTVPLTAGLAAWMARRAFRRLAPHFEDML